MWDTVRVSFCAAGAVFGAGLLSVERHFPRQAQYLGHSTPYTLHFTLHTLDAPHFAVTRSTPNFTLHKHSTLYTPHFKHSTLYTPHFTLHTLHFTLETPHSTIYTPQSTFYTPHSTLYTLHFTLCTLHSTLYTLHSAL